MRRPRKRLSITSGNSLQAGMLIAGAALLWVCTLQGPAVIRGIVMLLGYVLVYLAAHASAHWFIGTRLGIRFTHYSIGGSSHAASYPPGMRQLFERLPFLAVHMDKSSLGDATPVKMALMFGAGMTGSVVLSTLAALWGKANHVPGSTILLVANCVWFLGAIIADIRLGDYAKAGAALKASRAR